MITVLVLAPCTPLAAESMRQLAIRVYVRLINEDGRVEIEAYLEREGEALRDVDLIDSRVALCVVSESLNCEKCQQKSIRQALNRIVNHVVLDLIPRTDFLEADGKSVAKTVALVTVQVSALDRIRLTRSRPFHLMQVHETALNQRFESA